MTQNETLVLAYFAEAMTNDQVAGYSNLHAEDIEQAIHSLLDSGRLVQTDDDYEVAA